jgi:hypothetical protein
VFFLDCAIVVVLTRSSRVIWLVFFASNEIRLSRVFLLIQNARVLFFNLRVCQAIMRGICNYYIVGHRIWTVVSDNFYVLATITDYVQSLFADAGKMAGDTNSRLAPIRRINGYNIHRHCNICQKTDAIASQSLGHYGTLLTPTANLLYQAVKIVVHSSYHLRTINILPLVLKTWS